MRISMLVLSLSLAGAVNSVSSGAGVRLAGAIWAKQSHISGVITAVGNTSFEILAGPHVKERMRVRFDRGTVFLDSDPGDLEPGRDADIIGVRLRNGDVLAARVMIYNGDCPVRTPDGAILFRVHADHGSGAGPVVHSPCSSGAGSL